MAAQPSHPGNAMSLLPNSDWTRCVAVGILTMSVAACSKPVSDSSAPAVDAPSAVADPDSPCRLLSDAEVHAVFPGAGAGERERTREEYGISACVWSGDFGRLAVQTWKATTNSAEDEARGLAAGFVDPAQRAFAKNVRYESVAGIGEQASAVVEVQDAQRGILTDVAMLVARKGDRMLVINSDGLAHRDRAEALSKLRSLGQSAADRL